MTFSHYISSITPTKTPFTITCCESISRMTRLLATISKSFKWMQIAIPGNS
ncbi:hypothetical protein PSPO01_07753 [Paraphaeosphaeria sporulosa]